MVHVTRRVAPKGRDRKLLLSLPLLVRKPGQGKSDSPEAGKFFLRAAHISLQSRGLRWGDLV